MRALVISTDRVVWWPCEIKQPKEDGSGLYEKVTLRCQFRLAPMEMFQDTDLEDEEKNAKLVQKLYDSIDDWDAQDTQGQKIPATEENIKFALNIPYIYNGVLNGWIDCSTGGGAQKNLRGGSGSSRKR